jgi:MFS family permease
LALIASAYPAHERQFAFAVWGAVSSVALALGPLVGGALVEALGWRWVFLVNVPVGLATAALVVARVPDSRDPREIRLDVVGGATLAAALAALVFALLRGNTDGWSSPHIVALFAIAAVLLVLFVFVERNTRSPILDLAVWRQPTTSGVSAAVFALAASAFAMLAFLSLYLQDVLGHGPLGTGVRLLPLTVTAFVAAAVVGRLGARLPPGLVLGTGLAINAAGLLLMRSVGPASGWGALLPGMCCVGLGMGVTNPTVAATATTILEPARSGMASGLNNTFRLLGMATGIAVLGAAFQRRVSDRFLQLMPDAPHSLADAVAAGRIGSALERLPATTRPSVAIAARSAFVAGLDEILLVGAAVALVGALAAALLVRRVDVAGAAAAASVSAPTSLKPSTPQ